MQADAPIENRKTKAVESTLSTFEDEFIFLKDFAGFLQRSCELLCDSIGKKEEALSEKQLPILLLAIRIHTLLYCSTDLMANGFYDPTIVLLSVALENSCLTEYLKDRPNEAEAWIRGKNFSPESVRSALGIPDELYRRLSDAFVNSNVQGAIFHLKFPKELWQNNEISFDVDPHFSPERLEVCWRIALTVMRQVLECFHQSFKDILWERKEWQLELTSIGSRLQGHIEKERGKIRQGVDRPIPPS